MAARMASAHGILRTVSTHVQHDLLPPFPPRSLPGASELPWEDGEPMESDRHLEQMVLLRHSLGDHAAQPADAARPDGPARAQLYVGGNMFVYFSPRQLKGEHFRGPDVFVVLGAQSHERLSWVLWEELKMPDVVIEITSPSTRAVDHGVKKDIYAREWKTACYVLYDPVTHEIEGYRLHPGKRRYVRITPDANGDVEVAVLGLKLGLRDVRLSSQCGPPALRWLWPDGRIVPLRAEREAERADEATRRAGESARSADGEKRRADDEKRRADALEARLAALEKGPVRRRRKPR